MWHAFDVRVYYEDTDLAGIVYYANYLKFIERARSEWVRGLGMDQAALKAQSGLVFAVRRVVADYIQPAVYDDILQVRTCLLEQSGARLRLSQQVWRGDVQLFDAEVTLVCISQSGRPARLPLGLRAKLSQA